MMKKFIDTFSDSFVQTFDDTGKNRKELVRVMSMKDADMSLLRQLNVAGAGVFFTPNPCKGGRKESNVTKIRWVYVDMDNGTKREMQQKIKASPLRPDIIIESKRSYHLYWKVDCTKEIFDDIIKGLIQFYDGDKAISSTNEVLRFPNFEHMKDPKDPFTVRFIYFNIHDYTAEQMLSEFIFVEPAKVKKLAPPNAIEAVKDIPIITVLESLGVEVNKNNFIIENGEVTSASVNVKENYINRFSGREGSGSTIDACIHYGKMSMPEAIKYLKQLGGIDDVDIVLNQETETKDILKQNRKIFTWGTDELDKKISPIAEDTFVVFAGESGSGKTAFTFDMAIKNSRLGHVVLYISLEMNTDAIFTRLAREYAGINKEQWRDRNLITDDQALLYNRRKKELEMNENLRAVGFQNGVQPSVENIEGVIKKVNPDIVYIDNFDLIEKSGMVSTHDNENKISKRLLDLAKGLPMPIVLIHHLKKGDDNDLKKPRNLNSLRGSGKIVHNSDMVVLGFRPPFKEDMTDEELSKFTVIQLKDRDFGIGGYHICYFNKGSFYDKPVEDIADYAYKFFNSK